MRWAAGRAAGIAALAVLCASALQAADGQPQPVGEAPDDQRTALPVQADGQQDPLLEQTRQRLEQHLREQRQLDGVPEPDPELERRSMRFGVGYEWRMRSREPLGFDSPGSISPGAGPGGGFGGGPSGGFGGGPGGGRR